MLHVTKQYRKSLISLDSVYVIVRLTCNYNLSFQIMGIFLFYGLLYHTNIEIERRRETGFVHTVGRGNVNRIID